MGLTARWNLILMGEIARLVEKKSREILGGVLNLHRGSERFNEGNRLWVLKKSL
jgi:hypothetical protein